MTRRRGRRGRDSGGTGWRRRSALLAADVSCDGLPIEFELAGYAPLPVAEEEALYRIAQEALSNVVKHAGASHAQLRLATRQRYHGAEHHG